MKACEREIRRDGIFLYDSYYEARIYEPHKFEVYTFRMFVRDINHALHILATIPPITRYDRLAIHDDGIFVIDIYHRYTGFIGRSYMDKLLGGYNRRDIVRGIETLIGQLTLLAYECCTNLDSPYVRGNFQAYGMESKESLQYIGYLRHLFINVGNIQDLVDTCKLVYISDIATMKLLEDSLHNIQCIHTIIAPVVSWIKPDDMCTNQIYTKKG